MTLVEPMTLVDTGTRDLTGAVFGPTSEGETAHACRLMHHRTPDMLVLRGRVAADAGRNSHPRHQRTYGNYPALDQPRHRGHPPACHQTRRTFTATALAAAQPGPSSPTTLSASTLRGGHAAVSHGWGESR